MLFSSLVVVALVHVVLMCAVFVYAQRQRKADWVDVAWSAGIVIAAVIYAVWHDGALINRMIIGGMSVLWFGRLALHLSRRIINDPNEDSRYRAMRQRLQRGGKHQEQWGFFVFFLFQALLASLFALPVWALTQMTNVNVGLLALGVAIALIALIGESVADQQLYAFKHDKHNKGRTMQSGLWHFSRHPNYFFEWLHWFSYPVMGLASGLIWLWIYPVLMYVFLVYVTGIPFSEQQARAKRDDYAQYAAVTPRFFPSLRAIWRARHGH